MKPFEPLTRKRDAQSVRYLIVDAIPAFARKSLTKMVEAFGGETAVKLATGARLLQSMNAQSRISS